MSIIGALDWLGRRGTRAVAVSLVAGLALPQLAVLARPFLPVAVFALLTIAFSRIGRDDLRRLAAMPRQIAIASAWIMIAVPLIAGAGLHLLASLTDLPDPLTDALMLGILLMACAPPVVSSAAFAALLGLDAAFSLAVLVACMAATPFVAPAILALLAGDSVSLVPFQLGARLALLMGGAAALAFLVRRLAGAERIHDSRNTLDGVNVVLLFAFIVALMGDATLQFLADPARIAIIVALTFAVAFTFLILTWFLLRGYGSNRALTAALSASNRNMGMMPAVIGAGLPPDTWLWFALAQFPIYILPLVMTPVARKVLQADRRRARP